MIIMALSTEPSAAAEKTPSVQQKLQIEIRQLESRSNRGLWGLVLFLGVSIGAYQNFGFLPALPESWRQALGPPPPINLIHFALFIYTFSAAIMVLAKMMNESEPRNSLLPVLYLTVFYAFYALSGTLEAHFWAVFAAGIMVLGLESYYTWSFCSEQLHEARQRLANHEAAAQKAANRS